MPRKNNDITHRSHVEEVAQKLLEFWPNWKIRSVLGKKFDLSNSMMEKMIVEAQKLICESTNNWEQELAKHIARGNNLLNKAIEKDDLLTASTMFANLSRLSGMERTSIDLSSIGEAIQAAQIIFQLPEPKQKTLDTSANALAELSIGSGYQLDELLHSSPPKDETIIDRFQN